jgi:hypothetical protein
MTSCRSGAGWNRIALTPSLRYDRRFQEVSSYGTSVLRDPVPFFLVGLVLCIGFDIIRFPLIVAFHIAWVCWICATRLLGFPFRLIGAAWQNNPKILTSGLDENFE